MMVQVLAILLGAGYFAGVENWYLALSCVVGGGISLLNSAFFMVYVWWQQSRAKNEVRVVGLIAHNFGRLLVVVGLFVVAFWFLGAQMLALTIGFVLGVCGDFVDKIRRQ